MDNTFSNFVIELHEQVTMAKENDLFNTDYEDHLTAIMLEYLEDIGEVDSPILCPFRGFGLQMNAYHISEEYDSVDIFVSIYSNDLSPKSIPKAEVDACLKRALQLYRKAINDLYKSFERDSDTYGFASIIYEHRQKITNVRLIVLTNGLVKPIFFNNIIIDGADISFSVWDIDRLYRCVNSGKMRETIEIDFIEEFNTTIECIENKASDKYKVYLAIIRGDILGQLYEKHGARLLERNVRSFLQVKGQVNKGIRDTLKNEPDMFLAYNNGISVTAESVDVVHDQNGKPSITRIRDMQIVNGGQTTASIFNIQKNKKVKTDLTNVFVQMKLSVITKTDQMDEIVPKISSFANTQNKIQISDFSANDPFHRKIEEISRVTWASAHGGVKPQNWFYERARGQYADMVSRENTPLRKKQFKEEHPLFTKTDLAKYENSWDQLPYQVSEGAQKNFKRFTIRLNERGGFKPDAKYYESLIAKAIIFRRTEELVHKENYGGYRANIVTYTIAFLSNKTSQRIDLSSIWKEQRLTSALETEIIKVSKIVHSHITNPPGGANIGEWCKNSRCWNALVEKEYEIGNELTDELLSLERTERTVVNQGIDTMTEDEKKTIDEVISIPAEKWFALSHWAKETDNFQTWQRSLIFTMGTLINRKKTPSIKQANQAIKAYREAQRKGFS